MCVPVCHSSMHLPSAGCEWCAPAGMCTYVHVRVWVHCALDEPARVFAGVWGEAVARDGCLCDGLNLAPHFLLQQLKALG